MKSLVRLMVVLWMAMALVACAPITSAEEKPATPTSADLTAIDVCVSSASMYVIPSAYASKYGLYEKYGLDVTPHAIESGSDATIALIAGEANICHIAGPAVVNAALAGEDLVFVAGIGNGQTYSLVVRPEIERPEDLTGKVVAVSDLGSNSDAMVRVMLKLLGLQPDVDVTIVAVGGNPARLAAMESGQIAGTVLSLPESARAESMGYRVLLDPSQAQMDYQASAVVTKGSFLADNRPIVVAYVKTITEAMIRLRTDPEGTKSVMVEALGLDPIGDASLIDLSYQRFVDGYLPGRPYPTQAGVQAIIDVARLENPTAADLTAGDLVDLSIVQELDKGGFIDGLYTR